MNFTSSILFNIDNIRIGILYLSDGTQYTLITVFIHGIQGHTLVYILLIILYKWCIKYEIFIYLILIFGSIHLSNFIFFNITFSVRRFLNFVFIIGLFLLNRTFFWKFPCITETIPFWIRDRLIIIIEYHNLLFDQFFHHLLIMKYNMIFTIKLHFWLVFMFISKIKKSINKCIAGLFLFYLIWYSFESGHV